jgi:hypothetical protein
MERIETLIAKLKEQFDQQAGPALLLVTVQQLQNELSQLQPVPSSKILGTSKVAVMMPSGMNHVPVEYEKYAPKPKAIEESVKEIKEIKVVKEIKEAIVADKSSVSIVNDNGQLDMAFDPMTEIPTLSHQVLQEASTRVESVKPVPQLLPESVNDKLKQVKTELFEVLKETPIKD